MDFRLQVFQQVANKLSFTQAARKLHISQPAVTRHINELEKQFGKALFNRHGTKISLTPEGELLLVYAERILGLYKDLEAEFQDIKQGFPKQFSIGASTSISQYVLPKILPSLKQKYPSIKFEVLNYNSSEIETLLLEKKIDLGFTEGSTANPAIQYKEFVKDKLLLISNKENKFAKTNSINLDTLKSLKLVLREEGSGTRRIIENALLERGVQINELNIDLILGSSESIKTYIRNSNTFAILSKHAIKEDKYEIYEIEDLNLDRTFHFATLRGEHSGYIDSIQDFFISIYQNLYNQNE